MPDIKEYTPEVGNKIRDSVSFIKIIAMTDDDWFMVRRPARSPFIISKENWMAAYEFPTLSEAKLLKDGAIDVPADDTNSEDF